jgi:hypothetical protein
MAWSPFRRANAGIIGVEQPGDYANPIPTTSATGPTAATDNTAREWDVSAIPKGDIFHVACAWLPDHDLTKFRARV